MDTEWHKQFFSGIVLDFWQKAVPPPHTRREVDFLVRALNLRPTARVLDVPCGLGRHTVELAARGFHVTGIDASAEALDAARRAAAGASAEFRLADMRDLPGNAEFDAAYSMGNSFGYHGVDGARRFVRAIAAALRPDARFVLDASMAAESILPRLRDREWMQVDDILFLEENRYHAAESCYETTYTFVRGGKTETRVGRHWVFTIREIRAMLVEAGLVVHDLFGSIEGEPYHVGSPNLLIAAERRP